MTMDPKLQEFRNSLRTDMDTIVAGKLVCAHCGLPARTEIEENGNYFCCHGCKTAHTFLADTGSCELPEPAAPRSAEELVWLDQPEAFSKWVCAKRGDAVLVRLKIPGIHCASCVQVLERLYLKQKGLISSEVNFLRKELEITFKPDVISFSKLVAWLDSLGYSPDLSDPDNHKKEEGYSEATLLTMRMAVAGFCAGNIMLLSFPEYLGLQDLEFRHFFGWLNLALAIPGVFFSGWGYLKAVYLGITKGILNLDVPIGVGMIATLVLSLYEILTKTGAGYFDSLTGLIFFLLIGRWVQNRTFEFLSFERDFRSYFPLSITRYLDGKEESVLSSDVKAGDILKIRHGEIIPCDGVLLDGEAWIDYSFVSGESRTERIETGTVLMAGGKQTSGSIVMKATREMSRSQLVTLWNNPIFKKDSKPGLKTFADTVAYYFTPSVLILALGVAVTWMFLDPRVSLHAFVSILIIACPCTLSLAYPMALGNTMRLLGKRGFFLKNTEVIERLSHVNTLVFDKTGTLSDRFGVTVEFRGGELIDNEKDALAAVLSCSTHPLSRAVVRYLNRKPKEDAVRFNEWKGKGVTGSWQSKNVVAGSGSWIGATSEKEDGSVIHIKIQDEYKGYFSIRSAPLPFVGKLVRVLAKTFRLHLLSGDHETGQEFWKDLFQRNNGTSRFAQSPEDKLSYIRRLQDEERITAMIGDGLNDAGALQQSDVGIAIAADAHQFTPGSDAILIAENLPSLPTLIGITQRTMKVVRLSFIISLIYNVIGLSFAVTGHLQPIIAAILMPASSLSVVLFAWIGTEWAAKQK